jgi:hypothetical protein
MVARKKRTATPPRRRSKRELAAAARLERTEIDREALERATAPRVDAGAQTARIRMGAPATMPAAPRGSSSLSETATDAPIIPPVPAELADQARASLERVFSPEVSLMVMSTAFGVATAVTGEPDIYTASDDELEPLAPAFGRQISRIPIVKAAGPDNTELGILVLGLGFIVTRMLNEHARKRQAIAAAARATPEERRDEIRATARIRPAAAAAGDALEDGSASPHFGVRV